MASTFPGTLDSFSTSHADGASEVIHASDVNDLADAANKIEGELGTDPAGASATVAARLTALDTTVAGKVDDSGDTLSGSYGIGGAASGNRLRLVVADGDNVVGLRIEQNDVTNNPNALKIVNNSNTYALKVDHFGTGDAVNIVGSGATQTVVGINGSNTTLSTLKVTNDADATAGAIVGAVATGTARVAPIFASQNSGSGASFDHLSTGQNAVGIQLKAHATQAAELMQVKDSGGTVQLGIPAAGNSVNLRGAVQNYSSANNAKIAFQTTGLLATRNVADATPVLIVQNVHASSTGDVVQLKDSAGTMLSLTKAGVLTFADAKDIAVGTTTGTKIGTATTQKLGFFNKAPVVRPAAPTTLNELIAALGASTGLGLTA